VRRPQAAAAGTGRIRLRDFKRKIHPPSVSGEDKRPAHAEGNECRPHGKGDSVGLRSP
jgi:hypothetical protein